MGLLADVIKAGLNTKVQRDELTKLLMQRGPLASDDIAKILASGAPIWWSNASKTIHSVPLNEITRTVKPAEKLLPKKIMSPEDFPIGSWIIPATGDRTDAGKWLTHINGQPLSTRVRLEGGNGFMRSAAQIKDNAVWASAKPGNANAIKNKAKALMEKSGQPVHLMYSSMGDRSGDFSTMMVDALLSQVENGKITTKALKEFDDAMKSGGDWKGLDSPTMRDDLHKSGKLRKRLVEKMALAEHQSAGFPDMASTRVAISDPSMFMLPTGWSGHTISRLDDNIELLRDPKVPHTTYPYQITGEYVGGLDYQQPRQMIWRDFHAARRKAGKPVRSDDRAFTMSNPGQRVDQKLIDTLMKWRPK